MHPEIETIAKANNASNAVFLFIVKPPPVDFKTLIQSLVHVECIGQIKD